MAEASTGDNLTMIPELVDIVPDCNFLNSLHTTLNDSVNQSKYFSMENLNSIVSPQGGILRILNCNIRSYCANGEEFFAFTETLTSIPNVIVYLKPGSSLLTLNLLITMSVFTHLGM